MRNLVGLSLIACLFVMGCAEERPIERIADGNSDRLEKSLFVNNYNEQQIEAQNLLLNGNIWFSKVTVVKTSGNGGFVAAGFQASMKAGQFRFTRDQLRFENANNINIGDPSVAGELLASWNIQHSEARLAELDGRPTNREEEDNRRPWYEKRYFTVDWADTDIAEGLSFPYSDSYAQMSRCYTKRAAQVVQGSREITPDYIGFTVAVDYVIPDGRCNTIRRWVRGDSTFTAHYKFSFVKAKQSDYVPMVYAQGEMDPLMKKYGYFQTIVETTGGVIPEEILAENAPSPYPQEITILANRWHPEKTHVFYFAKDFPNKWKWIFNDPEKGVFAKTNALFKRHGLNNYNPADNTCSQGLCFEIRENSGQEFGDLRYSFIKLFDEADPAAPFGYGPSDANPFTGEIIAANSVLWTGYLSLYVARLQGDLVDQQNDHLASDPLIAQMRRTLGTSEGAGSAAIKADWTETASIMREDPMTMDAYWTVLPDFTYGFPGWSTFTSRPAPGDVSEEEGSSLLEILGLHRLTEALGFTQASEIQGSTIFEPAFRGLDFHLDNLRQGPVNKTGLTVYQGEHHLLDAERILASGRTVEDALNSIMYRVSIHEFGHNLSLRHNFYGSVDQRNFRRPFEIEVAVANEAGEYQMETRMYESTTSSVMEYQNLKQEYFLDENWEPYDEAALVYAYSDRRIDLAELNDTQYLYCTDEHRVLNAMCAVWDYGVTPSEAVFNMVEDYILMYKVRNQRFDRPYWNTRGYQSRIASTMMAFKKFLAFMRVGLPGARLEQALAGAGVPQDDVSIVQRRIRDDLFQANKLAIAFYDAVIQMPASEKDFRDDYPDSWFAEKLRIGIGADKLFAMFFLMGDAPILYNPNLNIPYTSYVEYLEGTPLTPVLDKVLENLFTARLDMDPGFEGFGRVLYAQNAYNLFNLSDPRLLDRIRFDCFSADELESELGISPMRASTVEGEMELRRWDRVTLDPTRVRNSEYQDVGPAERIGLVEINGVFYTAKEHQNKYAYEFIDAMINRSVNNESPLESTKAFILDSYNLFWTMKMRGGEVPECR